MKQKYQQKVIVCFTATEPGEMSDYCVYKPTQSRLLNRFKLYGATVESILINTTEEDITLIHRITMKGMVIQKLELKWDDPITLCCGILY